MIELPIDESQVLPTIVRLLRKRLTPEERRTVMELEREWFHRRHEQHKDRAA